MNCQDKVIAAIKAWLDNSARRGTIKINVAESEALSRALLRITDGMAFEPIDHPEKLDDKNTWVPFKKMILAVLQD